MNTIATSYIQGIHRRHSDDRTVHIIDMDDTLTLKPEGFNNIGLTKEEFFEKSYYFEPNPAVTYLLDLMRQWGDAIAICTARPVSLIQETVDWLVGNGIDFDSVLHSTGIVPSSIAKQFMIKDLRRTYDSIGTMIDDSPYNIQGARLQHVGAILLNTNDEYWAANPEVVYKV